MERDGEMSASNGAVVPGIRQVDRHHHQVAADGANEAEAPSSSLVWLSGRASLGAGVVSGQRASTASIPPSTEKKRYTCEILVDLTLT